MKNLSQISDSKDIITKEYLVAGYEPLLPATSSSPDTKYLNGLRQWAPIVIGSGGYASNLYLTNSTSTIVGAYKQLSYSNDITETEQSITRSSPGETLGTVGLHENPMGVTTIDSGTWKFTWYGKESTTAGEVRLRLEVFVRASDGTETTLFSVTSEALSNTSYTFRVVESIQPVFTVNTTDRLGVRTYMSTTVAASVTGYILVGGSHSALMNTPLNLRHIQLRGLNDDTNNVHVTSTERTNLTAITGLTGTSGLLRKTAADTWSLDEPVQIKRW